MPHLVGLLDSAVDGLSRDVAWEFGPGSQRPWQLILSPGGVRSVLPFTVAWAEAAPLDEAVEFLPAKPARGSPHEASIRLPDGQEVDLEEVRCSVSASDGQTVNLRVYHPRFSSMSEEERFMTTFLALDMALGEFVVMTSTDAIEPLEEPGPDMVPLSELRALMNARLR
jgi:hypothetical protein